MDVPVRRPRLLLLDGILYIAACRTGNDEPPGGTADAVQPSRVIAVPTDPGLPAAVPDDAITAPPPRAATTGLVPVLDTPPEPREDDSNHRPCRKKGPGGTGRQPGHDGHSPVNVCDGPSPSRPASAIRGE